MSEPNYQDWIGSKELKEDYITLQICQRFLATFDITDVPLENGDEMPPMSHWCLFQPDVPMREIGPDGHPKRGGFLPPVALPRRMFAGARTSFLKPLRIGGDVRREGEVISITEKSGKSGRLIFVGLRYHIIQDNEVCIEEFHDVVYREMGAPNPAPEPLAEWPELPQGAWSEIITPDPVMLFRYSGITFNAHRIHYDRSYVTQEEGYPGLVVHGPVISTSMAELVRKFAGRPMKSFAFRALAPVFDTAPFRVIGTKDGPDKIELRAERIDGQIAQTAVAELA